MISPEDIEYLKALFVQKADCDKRTDEINNKLSNDNTKLALIEQQLKTISWVSKTTLAGVITAIVGAILSLILK